MLKEFDEFVWFCVEHGGTLRSHKQFGEMAMELRDKIIKLESSKQGEELKAVCVCKTKVFNTTDNVCQNCGLPVCRHLQAESDYICMRCKEIVVADSLNRFTKYWEGNK